MVEDNPNPQGQSGLVSHSTAICTAQLVQYFSPLPSDSHPQAAHPAPPLCQPQDTTSTGAPPAPLPSPAPSLRPQQQGLTRGLGYRTEKSTAKLGETERVQRPSQHPRGQHGANLQDRHRSPSKPRASHQPKPSPSQRAAANHPTATRPAHHNEGAWPQPSLLYRHPVT